MRTRLRDAAEDAQMATAIACVILGGYALVAAAAVQQFVRRLRRRT